MHTLVGNARTVKKSIILKKTILTKKLLLGNFGLNPVTEVLPNKINRYMTSTQVHNDTIIEQQR